MNRTPIVLVSLLVACGAEPGSVTDSGESTTTTTTTTMGGATWQDVPTTSDGSTTTAADSGGPRPTTGVGESSGDAESSTSKGTDTSTGSTGEASSSGPDPATASTGDTGPPEECDDLDCAQCAMCSVAQGGPCQDIGIECESYDGCPEAATCLVTCGVSGVCNENCCAGLAPFAAAMAAEVNACVEDACSLSCDDYAEGVCV